MNSRKRIRPRNKDFTIGWICALSIELSAATVILDEQYEGPNEAAHYVLGRIGVHNVVVACLPAGQYGTNSAAVTASEVRAAFPSVQYWLLVGVGGGVPVDGFDIRLGDVVVSQPKGQHGGVIQYDMRKNIPDGRFIRTGWLNAPPPMLRSALSKMQSLHDLGTSKLQTYLSSFAQRDKFRRPPVDSDKLFDADYTHVGGDACQKCCPDRSVPRDSRPSEDVAVHFGLIASGNGLSRDGIARNTLSTELGNAICFEMEAAGLMNNFPCLVVRGICDYADSHKNKKWQPFAAATAAACAKEVLSCVPSSELCDDGAGVLLAARPRNVHAGPDQDSHITSTMVRMPTSQAQRDLYMDSLRFDTINARQASILPAHAQTCTWILTRAEYKNWLDDGASDGHNSVLWIKGNPGTGKSTLMKYILTTTFQQYTDACVVSFFFHARGDDLEKSTLGMYRSIVYQLMYKFPDLQDVLGLCPPKANDTDSYDWTVETLKTVLEQAVPRMRDRSVFVFIDALDECDVDEVREMISSFQHLGEIAKVSNVQFRTCCASRHYPHLTIDDSIQLTLEEQVEHENDIKSFLDTELKVGHGKWADDMRSDIFNRSSAIFLWVVIVVRILNKEYPRSTRHAMQERLHQFPEGLERLFEDILLRDNQNMDHLALCLQWVLFARQPLNANELYFAILSGTEELRSGNPEPDEIDAEHVRNFILHNSKGLVEETRSEPKHMQFIHESVRDYFLRGKGLNHPIFGTKKNFEGHCHERLKLCCENYCSYFSIKQTNDCRMNACAPLRLYKANSQKAASQREKVCARFPFLSYAVCHILYHSDQAVRYNISQGAFVESFSLEKWCFIHNLLAKFQNRQYSSQVNLLYVLADKCLPHLIKVEGERVNSIDMPGERYKFPLLATLVHGHRSSLKALLTRHCKSRPEISDQDIEEVTTALLENPVKETDLPKRLLSMFEWTLGLTSSKSIELLVPAASVTVAMVERFATRLLGLAARHGYLAVKRILSKDMKTMEAGFRLDNIILMLLSNHAQIYEETSRYKSAFMLAIESNEIEVVKQFLEYEGQVREDYCEPLLLAALNNERMEIARMLSEHGVRMSSLDIEYAKDITNAEGLKLLLVGDPMAHCYQHSGLTVLMDAAAHGYTRLAQAALSSGADVLAQDREGHTALMYATNGENVALLKMLLAHGADVNAQAYGGQTALIRAMQFCNAEMWKTLIAAGARLEDRDSNGETALLVAAYYGHVDAVNILLAHGADVNARSDTNTTALMWAVQCGVPEQVRALLAGGAEVDPQDAYGQTALMRCRWEDEYAMPKLLLAAGADLHNIKNDDGETSSVVLKRRGFPEEFYAYSRDS